MKALQRARTYVLVGAVVFASYSARCNEQSNSPPSDQDVLSTP